MVSITMILLPLVTLLAVLAGTGVQAAVTGDQQAAPKPPPDTCNSTAWDNVNIRVPSVPEPMGGPMCQQSDPFVIVEEVVWRCETRYCCDGACQCASMTLTEEPCMVSPPMTKPVELVCLVQHKKPPRFFRYVCCEGYEEVDTICAPKIDCDTNGGGCDQGCQKPNGTHTCTCNAGYELYNRTKCRAITTTTVSTTKATTTTATTTTTTTKPTTKLTTTTTTSQPTTRSPATPIPTPTKATTTTTTTTTTTSARPTTTLKPSTTTTTTTKPTSKTTTSTPTKAPIPTEKVPVVTSSTTSASTSGTTANATIPYEVPNIPDGSEGNRLNPKATTTTKAPFTTTTNGTGNPGAPAPNRAKHGGPAIWILIMVPILVCFLIIFCFMCFCWRKRKPLYAKQDDEVPTDTYDNYTYGKSGAAGVVIPGKKGKERPPLMMMDPVVGVEDHPKSVKIIKNDLYADRIPSTKGGKGEPKVVFGNYISDNVSMDEEGYMIAMSRSVYSSGLPPMGLPPAFNDVPPEESPYEPIGPGLAAGPLPFKEPLQGYRTAEIENSLNDNMEGIYSELP